MIKSSLASRIASRVRSLFPRDTLNAVRTLRFTVPLLLTVFATSPALAGGKILSWGGDSEGGAPFVFQDPENPALIIGFEVDFAQAIAEELGMTAQFVQNQWDGLVPGLQRGNYDIIINGLEITEDRKQEIHFSTPYYITFEQLTVRKTTDDIVTLDDCKGRKVGTLKFSLAHRILEQHGGIQVVTYDDDTNPYSDLLLERLDAVLMDYPIALYRGAAYKDLKFAGEPISEMLYGVGVRKEDTELLGDINRAIERLSQSGRLREILTTWNLWNQPMAVFVGDNSPASTPPEAYRRFLRAIGVERDLKEKLIKYASFIPLLGKGAITTLEISLLAMTLAVACGLVLALTRLYAPSLIGTLATMYIEVVRGTPLLIQLYLIFYGLPNVGIKLTPLTAAVLGLGMNYAAYEAENYRAGILSIPKSQMDAALALGMTRWQALKHVILPQAMRLVIPPVTNDFISLLKDSSLVSVITMVELTKVYGQLAATYFDYLGIGILAAGVYFLIGLPFVRLSRMAEKRFQGL